MRIAIDAMGGDNAPQSVIEGVNQVLSENRQLEVTLIGNQHQIEPLLSSQERITIIHTEDKIEANDSPTRAVRRKKQASMVLAINEVKEKRADAVISAGNTGALMTAGLFGVGRIKGIDRPALAPTLPTIANRDGFLFLDVGSNMDAKPEHLLQYAIMGSIYANNVMGKTEPRVGLLNVGEEPGKGNELSKEAYELLKKAPVNFIGNVEARDLLHGVCDVVVCDGFSGNLVLKTIEGTAISLFSMIKQTLTSSFLAKAGALLMGSKLKSIKTRMDYTAYGGACLFGLGAPVIKAHGSSNATAIYNTIKQAGLIVENDVVETIEKTVLATKDEWSQ